MSQSVVRVIVVIIQKIVRTRLVDKEINIQTNTFQYDANQLEIHPLSN